MKTVIVIQARVGSSRLPGKVLMDICGQPMLQRIIERCRASRVGPVIVATTKNKEDSAIEELCCRPDVMCSCYRGDSEDVLLRFMRAVGGIYADSVMRITGDCPFVDPLIMKEVAAAVNYEHPYSAAAVNSEGFCYADGLDSECFTWASLAVAFWKAEYKHQRENVTPWIQSWAGSRAVIIRPPFDLSKAKLSVDTEDELNLARNIYQRVGKDIFGWQEAWKAWKDIHEHIF